MSTLPSVANLVSRNSEYRAHHEPIATFQARLESGSKLPGVAVVTCADPRCIPENFLKLETWDAIVIRTAGSNVKTALPSIIAIDQLVGLQEIMVINHTDCGALAFRDNAIRTTLKERAPDMSSHIENMEFGQITCSLEDRVREHVALAKNTPLLREQLRVGVTGYIYDLKSGSLQQVE